MAGCSYRIEAEETDAPWKPSVKILLNKNKAASQPTVRFESLRKNDFNPTLMLIKDQSLHQRMRSVGSGWACAKRWRVGLK